MKNPDPISPKQPSSDKFDRIGIIDSSPSNSPFSSLSSLNPEEIIRNLRVLHRAPDGYIGFGRKNRKGEWQGLSAYRLEQLETKLPTILPWLGMDAYFTVNAMYRPAWKNSPITGQPSLYSAENNLRYFNACYVDLDVGRTASESPNGHAMRWEDAMTTVTDLIAEGRLPQSSMIARSGRGAYVFWLLQSEDNPDLPPRSYPEKVKLYRLINHALSEKLQAVCADMGTFDAARVLRIPGTLHSKCNQPAQYMVQHDGENHPFTYTLDELMLAVTTQRPMISVPSLTSLSTSSFNSLTFIQPEWIEVEETGRFGNVSAPIDLPSTLLNNARLNKSQQHSGSNERSPIEEFNEDCLVKTSPDGICQENQPPNVTHHEENHYGVEVFGRPIKSPKTVPRRVEGALALNFVRFQDLRRLFIARGGWQLGTRRRGLSLLALCARNAGLNRSQVSHLLVSYASECQPPYPCYANDESLRSILDRTFSGNFKKLRSQKIIDSIGITDDEARTLSLETLVSDTVKAERQKPPFGGMREQKRIERRKYIVHYIEKHGMVSCRVLKKELRRVAISASHQSINEDLRVLAAQNSQPRKIAGRRPKHLTVNHTREQTEQLVKQCLTPEGLMTQELWERIRVLLPPRKAHPLKCHRPRVDDRSAMNAIIHYLNTGCAWNDLNALGLCSSSSAHRRFTEWKKADVFENLWDDIRADAQEGNYAVLGNDWFWLMIMFMFPFLSSKENKKDLKNRSS